MAQRDSSKLTKTNDSHTFDGEIRQGTTAENISEMLKNPDKYGLSRKDVDNLTEAAWYITGLGENLSKEKISKEVLKRPEYKKAGVKNPEQNVRIQIDKGDGTFEERNLQTDIEDERRKKIIKYFDGIKKDRERSLSSSNSLSTLYTLEEDYNTLRILNDSSRFAQLNGEVRAAMLQNLKTRFPGVENFDQARVKLLENINETVPALGTVITAGKGMQYYKNPAKYLSNAAGKYASKIATQQATKVLISMGLQAAAGTVAPIIGNIAAWLASNVVSKFLNNAVDNLKRIGKIAGQALIGLAIFIGDSVAAGVVIGATSTAVIGIVLVPLVAFIVFIINAGGYVVPPGSAVTQTGTQPGTNGASAQDNPYIRVVKTANPPGPFSNSALPMSVQYTITVTAKKETLTNVKFQYNCQVVKDGSTPQCPSVTPTIPTGPEGGTIEPGTPVSFTYSQNYSVLFQDSLVMDTLVVTANVASDAAPQTSSGFAAIIIGTPPTKCFVLDGGWPDRERSIMLQAIAQIVQYTGYANKICARGNVNLIFGNSHACYSSSASTTFFRPNGCQSGEVEYGGRTTYPSISFYSLALGNLNSAFYTLAHESGHIFSAVQPSIWGGFRDTLPLPPDNNGYVCTYPIKSVVDPNLARRENFAESIALYIRNGAISSATRDFTCLGGSFQSKYPAYYNYMVNSVFNP